MKQIKKTELERLSFEGTLDEVIEQLQKLKGQYPGYETLEISEDSCYEGGYTYDLVGCNIETDEQEKARIDKQAEYDKINLEFKRRQYEALKTIFEPGPCEPLKD